MKGLWKRSISSHALNGNKSGSGSGSGIVAWKGRKRFYQTVDARLIDGNVYGVFLDQRRLMTPTREYLNLTSKPLAISIAQEWDSQIRVLEPSTMPMTSITSSAIHLNGNHDRREKIEAELLRFLTTDVCLYHSDPADDDPLLVKKQQEYFPRMVNWMKKAYGDVDVVTTSVFRKTNHPQSTYDTVLKRLKAMNHFELAATESLTHGCKSLVLALALVDREIDIDTAFHTSRVEEEHQIERWGVVEGGHDIDRANLMTQIAAASNLLWFTRSF